MELFNKEDVYDNEISPLIRQVIDICNKHKIPMLASFTYENDKERGIGRCTTILNGHEDRKDEALQKALSAVKNCDGQTIAFAITKRILNALQ